MRVELENVLTLNRVWQPLTTVSIKKAMKIVFGVRAKIVCPETYNIFTWDEWVEQRAVREETVVDQHCYLKTAHLWIRKPEVIVLSKFAGYPNKGVPYSRRGVYERDSYRCQYCGIFPRKKNMTLDHVHPVSRGGHSTWDNTVLSCLKCNHAKADRTPHEAEMPLMAKPFQPTQKQLILRGVTLLPAWKPFLKDVIAEEALMGT